MLVAVSSGQAKTGVHRASVVEKHAMGMPYSLVVPLVIREVTAHVVNILMEISESSVVG